MLSDAVAQGRREHIRDAVVADVATTVYCTHTEIAVQTEGMSDDATTL